MVRAMAGSPCGALLGYRDLFAAHAPVVPVPGPAPVAERGLPLLNSAISNSGIAKNLSRTRPQSTTQAQFHITHCWRRYPPATLRPRRGFRHSGGDAPHSRSALARPVGNGGKPRGPGPPLVLRPPSRFARDPRAVGVRGSSRAADAHSASPTALAHSHRGSPTRRLAVASFAHIVSVI
jgi:hypothetical protein